jgi:hypothetical protein
VTRAPQYSSPPRSSSRESSVSSTTRTCTPRQPYRHNDGSAALPVPLTTRPRQIVSQAK